MTIVAVVSVAVAWVKANVWPLIVGFVARHVSPAFIAKVEALWAKVEAAVKSAFSWLKAHL